MIWKWDTNVVASLDDNAGGSKNDSESELDSNKSTGSPESENGNEEDVQETVTHTVTFKVIGCKKEQIYQDVLEKCRDAMQDGQDVPVRLTPEPENPFDSRAIAFMCFIDEQWYRIGYVVSEILEDVHQSLARHEITDVRFAWVKFITHWRSGYGYYAGVDVSKKGYWPSAVVRSASTR